jgi:hypothetical protein
MGAVGDAEAISCDEVTRDVVPAVDGGALPPTGDVGLGSRSNGTVECAERLDLVEVLGPGSAGERVRPRA